MQIGFTFFEAENMPLGELLDYIAIDNVNKYDFVEIESTDDEFDRLLDFD